MSWFTFFICGMLLLLILIDGTNVRAAQAAGVPDSAAIAIDKIQQAESAGAEVSDLTSRFNTAMNLLEQAETSTFKSCGSYDDCINNSDEMFVSIVSDAIILKEQADKRANEERTSVMPYAIIVAFAISFSCVCLYRLWRNYQLRRFLSLEIEETR